jgi:two-component system KDP operon response regulator KdpE
MSQGEGATATTAAPPPADGHTGGRILVIDDSPGIHQLLDMGLTGAGFTVISALSGPDGLTRFLESRPDAVVVDVLMPGMDGYELCRRVRELSDVPIVMLSALRNEPEIIQGLEAGADDYVTKPFSIAELVARLRAHIRRQRRDTAGQRRLLFDSGKLVIDVDSQRVTRGDEEVRLSPTEFRLLAYLTANAGRVVPHSELIGQLWGSEGSRLGPYLKIYVRRLRQKLEPSPSKPRYILSRHGSGYVFQGQPAS